MRSSQILLAVIGTIFGIGTIITFIFYFMPFYSDSISNRIQNYPLSFIAGCVSTVGIFYIFLISKKIGERLRIIYHYEKLMHDLIIYLRVYQGFDTDNKRDLDEIVSLINSIPQNRGYERNGVFFDGNFEFLSINKELLKEQAALFKENNVEECSLNDLVCYIRINFADDTKKGKFIRNHSLA